MATLLQAVSAHQPQAQLSELHRADGSAMYASPDGVYTIMASVNGPIEVQRRDELPEEAVVDVIVRPAAGVGGPRERHLESVLQSALRQIILVHNFPRKLIQITLQVMNTPDEAGKINQAAVVSHPSQILRLTRENLPLLPALLQASALALLSAVIPLSATVTSTLIARLDDGMIEHPTTVQLQQAASTHVLAFTSQRQLLVAESEGTFSLEEWNEVHDQALQSCCGTEDDPDTMRDVDSEPADGGLQRFIRTSMREKVDEDLHWQRS